MIEINPLQANHWNEVKSIYEEGIATRNATFETSAPTWDERNASHLKHCRLVAVEEHVVTGWEEGKFKPLNHRLL